MNKKFNSLNLLATNNFSRDSLINSIKEEKIIKPLIKSLKISDEEIWDSFNNLIDYKIHREKPDEFPYHLHAKRNEEGKLVFWSKLADNQKANQLRLMNNMLLQDVSSPIHDETLRDYFIDENKYYELNSMRQEVLNVVDKKLPLSDLYGVFFYGPANSERSEYLYRFANTLALTDNKVAYININDLNNEAKKTIENSETSFESRKYLIDTLSNVDILILDEIGLNKYTQWFLETFMIKILENRIRLKKITYFGSYYPLNILKNNLINERKSQNGSQLTKPLIDKIIKLIISLTKVEVFIGE
ncbi:hypothetical protein H9M94_01030 [Mycoplasma sp. Pen4]|uniref:hypothetical protein n=1 Tax=Mycoplasma sp. Pen4 TaxID=640330 RepID=UPI0016544CC5|nr:hypothetical protein [Mycoplasma sp. Pen4]QNM93842.1 hypothetical protein H9M94_01030 [Mycoplasma sp. Pen4]